MDKDELINLLGKTLKEASDHLDYCGYGDSWEREISEGLSNRIANTIEIYESIQNNA